MNKKGFTIIELLAVIVIMSIVLVIAIPNSIQAYKKTKLKSEQTFVERISQVVDSYVTLNTDSILFSSIGEEKTKNEGDDRVVTVYRETISFQQLIDEKLIQTKDYINPNNKNVQCSSNAEIEIYKDSDFVYCHRIKALSLGCLTDEYIEYINEKNQNENSNYESSNNPYVINTCIWE